MAEFLRYNLQTFAEESGAEGTEGTEGAGETNGADETNGKGNSNEVVDQSKVQEMLVEMAKQKRAIDKLTKENGELTKKYRATLSEQEKASIEKAEAEAERNAEFESLKRQVQVNELTENFMDLGYSKDLAKKAATAQADGDTETLLEVQKQFNDAQKKAWEAEFYKNKPELNAGTGQKTISKEEFEAMSLQERTKLKRENEAEYKRLVAL